MKTVLIAGASGMVGKLILQECLSSNQVKKVFSLVRKSSGINHPKLQEIVVDNFSNFEGQQDAFKHIDAAFFCIGVYTGQVPKEQFKIITVDYAIAFAEALKKNSPKARLCLLSGAGADRTEKSRTAFAKFKGMAENKIALLGLNFHSFRPAYIYPVEPRKEPNLMYSISRSLYPMIKLFGTNMSIKSTELAQAMFKVGIAGANQEVFENKDILGIINYDHVYNN